MSWTQIAFDTPDDLKDAIVGALADDDIGGIWESGEPRPGETRLVIYVSRPDRVDAVERGIAAFFERLGRPAPALTRLAVADRDWNEEWKKTYTSFAIGKRFFVIPSWRHDACPPERMPIRIDPGQAFGSGVHETTQMTAEALEWLAPDLRPGSVVLDLGTGSGILAIAARMLGAETVIACDFDDVATGVAQANATRNEQEAIRIYCGSADAVAAGTIDLMLANLTSDTIAALFPAIDRALTSSGYVVFSGILIEQGADIRVIAENLGYFIREETARGEWLAMVCQKHGA
ncbi:MAG TPA: 50S ribosomal protein L11 methyltransferase [Terriglobia bacterium]|nr:50S ribosomal protein L11 methyltransferase [Terriglobia bacterium]